MFFAIAIASAMFFPGILEFIAACRLALYYREDGGFLTFCTELLHGILQPATGIIIFLAILLGGSFTLDLPVWITLPLFIIFMADRIFSALMALWLAGIIHANWFRKNPTKQEMEKIDE